MATPAEGIGRACRRVHVVLLPGFAGFDALGQLEYFAGMTSLLARWRNARATLEAAATAPVVLHYFDSFPTAGVATRARRLKQYLAKRIARAEFVRPGVGEDGDILALVGHSTGGLDIRYLLADLADAPDATIPCDALVTQACPRARDLLRMINRVVFLSVPQWGTNLGDWLALHSRRTAAVIRGLRIAAATTRLPLVDGIQDSGASLFAALAGSQLGLAVADALSETDPGSYTDSEMSRAERIATADERRSLLRLWLRHMASDFQAIEDLTVTCRCERCDSPAHANEEARAKEVASWRQWQVATTSFATIGPPPGGPGTREAGNRRSDVVYRWCYETCADGPFGRVYEGRAVVGEPHEVRIGPTDNDGIVNTASMFWPHGPDTRLVHADHMDIVGHRAPIEATRPGQGRLYRAYDLLGSGSSFDADKLRHVWDEIFDFCAAPSLPPGAPALPPRPAALGTTSR